MLSQNQGEPKKEGNTFEVEDKKTGLTYERITIELPKNVVDFYRALAYLHNKEESLFIAEEIIHHLETQLNNLTHYEAKDMFNLTPVFKALKKRQVKQA